MEFHVPSLNRTFEALRPRGESAGAGAGEGVAALRGAFDILAWADPFGPDGALPDTVAAAITGAVAGGTGAHYEPPTGLPELRRALAAVVGARLGRALDAEKHILVTPGSDSGLYYALAALLEPGDEVLVPTPSYPSNLAVPSLLGARPVAVPLLAEEGYQLDVDALARAVTDRTRAVVLTHPNNPTSTVHRPDRLHALAELVVDRDLMLVSDQAFEDHVFDGAAMVSPASIPGLWERTISVHSFSKGYGLSGLRVGYLVAHERLLEPLLGAAVLVLGAPNTLAQVGALAALRDDALLPGYARELEARRTYLHDRLREVPGVRLRPSESGILSWVDTRALGSAAVVAAHLRERAGVVVNEGDAYGPGGEGHLRVVHGALADRGRLESAVDRIAAALRELTPPA
jgi:aspartate/methionine/tyrosine aminotransferase